MPVGLLASVISLALLAPLSAQAAVLEVSGSTMTYRAEPGETNRPGYSEGAQLRLVAGEYRFREASTTPITIGAGCRQAGSRLYACDATGVTRIIVSLGNLEDALGLAPDLPVGTRLRGGAATDTVNYSGGSGGVFVTLDGKANDGGSGRDDVGTDVERQLGTDQGDLLSGDLSAELFAPGDGNDSVFGGAGNDNISIAKRDESFPPPDQGDGDDSANGGAGDDFIEAAIIPTDGEDGGVLYRSGADRISCGPDRDLAVIDDGDTGGRDCEVLGTFSSNGQVWRGSPGNDEINLPDIASGLAPSRAFGLDGDDVIRGAPFQQDELNGGNGNDRIDARDGEQDVVDCGPGTDTVYVDSDDVRRGCESVRR